jgi:hypothetical protein
MGTWNSQVGLPVTALSHWGPGCPKYEAAARKRATPMVPRHPDSGEASPALSLPLTLNLTWGWDGREREG